MTWAKVDDTLFAHRKVRAAGLEAMGLWVMALSYCMSHLTDGRVTFDDVTMFVGNRARATKLAAALVSAGLWETESTGWVFHDWLRYQPSREQVAAERERKVEAGRRGGQANAQAWAKARAQAPAEAPASPTVQPPSRPVPSRPDPFINLDPRSGSSHACGREGPRPKGRAGPTLAVNHENQKQESEEVIALDPNATAAEAAKIASQLGEIGKNGRRKKHADPTNLDARRAELQAQAAALLAQEPPAPVPEQQPEALAEAAS